MPSVFVYSAGQTAAKHFERSIETGIPVSTFQPLVPADFYARLQEAYPDGTAYLWGDRGGDHGRQYWQQIGTGDLALCYRQRRIVAASTVIATLENEAAGIAAWPDATNEPYRLLFFLSKPAWTDVPVSDLPQYFGKVYQGLRRLPTSEQIVSDFGSLNRFVSEALLRPSTTSDANALPDVLTAAQVSEAVRLFDSGREHGFADSTGYDLIFEGRRYPPKAIVGIAAEIVTGTRYGPQDFSGGLGSKCFRLLQEAGFQIVEKATSGAWLFQGNPQRFDIDGYLRRGSFIYWGVNRHLSDFRLGDRCLIWRAGPNAGLIGIGELAELPKAIREVAHPEALGLDLWQQEGDLGNEMKVGVQLREVRLDDTDGFVSRREFAADPALSESQIIRFRQGSVFHFSPAETEAALALWESRDAASYQSVQPDGRIAPEGSDLLPVFDDQGNPLRATCRVRGSGHQWEVTIESRGGTLGTASETNADYSQGFELLISRLAAIDAVLVDSLVDSRKLVEEGLTDLERRLHADNFSYPIRLQPSLAAMVATALRRAQPNIGSERRKGSGNSTRRVLLKIELSRQPEGAVSVEDYLTGARSLGAITAADLDRYAEADPFEPTSIIDERKKAIAEIVKRQGAPLFRRQLLECYGGRCAVTGCDAEAALEAAHIIAYLGPRTNSVQNGLLLRADLHTLFDRGLLGIDPDTKAVILHDSLQTTVYGVFAGQRIALPDREALWPNSDALRRHLVACGLLLMSAPAVDVGSKGQKS
jgi:putative restriction endonuclease